MDSSSRVLRRAPLWALFALGVWACNGLLGIDEGKLAAGCESDAECAAGSGAAGMTSLGVGGAVGDSAGGGESDTGGGETVALGGAAGADSGASTGGAAGADTDSGGSGGSGGANVVVAVCEAADTECDSERRLRTCNKQGQWSEAVACPYVCSDAKCAGECAPDTVDCHDGVTPKTCSADGVWQVNAGCSGVCTSGKCAGSCSPSQRQCASGNLLLCNEAGVWETLEECAYVCNPESLECDGECQPNQRRCNDSSLQICESDGTWAVQSICDFECLESMGTLSDAYCSQCVRADQRCASGTTLQACDSLGRWQDSTCDHECIDDSCVGCTGGDGHCPNGCTFASDTDCLKPTGTACTASSECSSGRCVDDVCCNAACNGTCDFCNLPTSVGTCSNMAFDADPDNCGSCGDACSSNHIGRACSAGDCSGGCLGSWRDCNGNKRSDGCEVDTASNPAHCGTCGTECPYGLCLASACAATKHGLSSPGADSANRFSGTMYCHRINISTTGELVALGINVGVNANVVDFRLALYTNSAGAPLNLLAQTNELSSVSQASVEGRTKAAVAAGDHWLCMQTAATLRVTTEASLTSAVFTGAHTYGSFPQPAPVLTKASPDPLVTNVYAVTTP